MRPVTPLSGLKRPYPAKLDPNKAEQDRIRPDKRSRSVTRVTTLRALLKACREALKDGEIERADRILVEAQRALAAIELSVG
jgi:ribosomal protein S20